MGIDEETAARAFVSMFDVEHLDAGQVSRMLEQMAPDARYHVYAWEPPHVGHDAIRAELLRQSPFWSDGRINITTIGSVGSTVFMERRDSMKIAGVPITVHVASVLEIDADGKVAVWREYLDRKEVETKLSVDISTISAVGGAQQASSDSS